jgi:hypothetical protein
VESSLSQLITRVYKEFIAQTVTHDEIREWLLPRRRRLAQILPAGQAGADLMQLIVTALTMTSSENQDAYNAWATDIVQDALLRDQAAAD